MSAVMRRFLRELAFFTFFLALTIAYTWPLAAHLSTFLPDLGDPILNAWILDWDCHAFLTQPLHLYDAPMFFPGRLPLAYSENLVAIALLMLPLHIAGVSPIAIYNIAYLLGFALSGYGAFVLARSVILSGRRVGCEGSPAGGAHLVHRQGILRAHPPHAQDDTLDDTFRTTAGALVAGIFFAFVGFKFDHQSHLQIVFSAWVPLLLAALLAYWRNVSKRNATLLSLVWIALGLTNVYYLMFCAVSAAFTIGILAIVQPRDRRFWIGLAASFAIAFLVLLPFLLPYRTVSKHYGITRNVQEVIPGSANGMDWLTGAGSSVLYASGGHTERQLFPGLFILILTCVAIGTPASPPAGSRASRLHAHPLDALILLAIAASFIPELHLGAAAMRGADIPLMLACISLIIRFAPQLRDFVARSPFSYEAWAAATWILTGILGSLGIHTFFYAFFYRRFGPFGAMRVPARWAVLAYAGLAVWGALGVDAILARVRARRIVAIALVAIMALEVIPNMSYEIVGKPAPVYQWLAREKPGPLIEMPVWDNGVEFDYLLGSMQHHQPIANGYSGVAPTEAWLVRDALKREAYDEYLSLIERYGVRLIIVHGDDNLAWMRDPLARGRLVFLRRFGHDHVFAITRNLPSWKHLR